MLDRAEALVNYWPTIQRRAYLTDNQIPLGDLRTAIDHLVEQTRAAVAAAK